MTEPSRVHDVKPPWRQGFWQNRPMDRSNAIDHIFEHVPDSPEQQQKMRTALNVLGVTCEEIDAALAAERAAFAAECDADEAWWKFE